MKKFLSFFEVFAPGGEFLRVHRAECDAIAHVEHLRACGIMGYMETTRALVP